jgi:aconitate hydratase
MIKLLDSGAYLVDGATIIPEGAEALALGFDREAAKRETIAYGILAAHNISGDEKRLRIKFDKLTSHDITFVGIIQTARASGLTEFPLPYVLTNCHNSLCAVGGTINEDDHMFGLSCARKYGGVYVPPHQAVIHQYAREMMAGGGKMILGSDSHTRYGALGTMAMGEGGPELVKQLLNQTYDIHMPEVVLVYLTGSPGYGVGPQDVALAIIGAVFANGYVKNKVMEFAGPGVKNLSADFRIGIDVMTTETTCLSSIWETDEFIEEYYEIHGRADEHKALRPGAVAYYDGAIRVDLDKIEPMIAMPFHPSNTYTIAEVNENLGDILNEVEKKAAVSLGQAVSFSLKEKMRNGQFYVDQGIVAGCAGGGFENICAVADIMRGRYTGNGGFSLSVYPASTPIYMELIKNGCAAAILETGAILKTAFCGPCFGAGDTPANNAFSIRHSTRNFPNREGSKLQNGQISSVALMDARSIAATAVSGGRLTSAADLDVPLGVYQYYFDGKIYQNRVFDAAGKAEPDTEIQFGPGIKDWPEMIPLTENLLLKVVAEIHDPVTTTDELIPSGETSSYRSNPLGLAEYTLSRKCPDYVGLAKEVRDEENQRRVHSDVYAITEAQEIIDGQFGIFGQEIERVFKKIEKSLGTVKSADSAGAAEPTKPATVNVVNTGIGSVIFAVKPGDGSAREQAASCQKVLGGWANISHDYATKRYRSNLINWGMLPFLIDEGPLPFRKGDYIFIPGIYEAVKEKHDIIKAYVFQPENEPEKKAGTDGSQAIDASAGREFQLRLGELTDEERDIIVKGCLINYNKVPQCQL